MFECLALVNIAPVQRSYAKLLNNPFYLEKFYELQNKKFNFLSLKKCELAPNFFKVKPKGKMINK